MQHVARAQGAAAVAAELAEREGALAAQIVRHIDAAAQRTDSARAGAVRSCRGSATLPAGTSSAVFIGCSLPSSVNGIAAPVTATTASRVKRSVGPLIVISSAGGAFGVAQQAVAEAQRAIVHRPRRRHADRPVAEAAGIVLHGGLRAGARRLRRCWRGSARPSRQRVHGGRWRTACRRRICRR